MTTASATAPIARAVAPSRMPNPTPSGSEVLRADGAQLRADVGDVEVRRAGNALQRHVVDVPAREARDLLDPRLGRGRRQQEDRIDPGPFHELRERPALLRRIVDDEDAVDAGGARALDETLDAHRLDRVRVPHQHDRRWRRRERGTRAT